MKVASIAKAKSQLNEYVEKCSEGPVVFTRNGKAVAVLLGMKNEDELDRLIMAHSPRLRAILNKSRKDIAEGRGIPHDEFWRQLDEEYAAKERPKRQRKKS